MNDLQVEVSEAVFDRLLADGDGLDAMDFAIQATDITYSVWGILEDKIGTVQERLMRDLDDARTRARVAESRETALVEQVEILQRQLTIANNQGA